MAGNNANTCVHDTLRVSYANAHWFLTPGRLIVTRKDAGNMQNHILIVMRHGRYDATWYHNGKAKPVFANAGDIMLWPMNAKRHEHNDPADRQISINVYFRGEEDLLRNLPRVVKDRQGLIGRLAETLLAVKAVSLPEKKAVQNTFVAAMVSEFVRLASVNPDDLVARVARYTEENMAHRFTLKDLAAHMRLNDHHLGRRYKAATGHTPMDDVRRIKVEHARAALQSNPRMAVKDLAFRVGAQNAGQLRRWLKRHLGMTVRDILQT